MDRAGYCFGSVLGQAVFDSSDCRGKSVSIDLADQATVATIRDMEARWSCKVDTGQSNLDVDLLWLRRALRDQPVRDEFESACIGWKGAPVALHAGHDVETPVVGQITPGLNVVYSFIPVGSWTYVEVKSPDWDALSGGWLNMAGRVEDCADFAG